MTTEEIKKLNEGIVALRAEVEKDGKASKVVLERIEASMGELDKKHTDEVAARLKTENELKDAQLKIEQLDRVVSSPEFRDQDKNAVKKAYLNTPEFKALKEYVIGGEERLSRLSAAEQKALRTDDNPSGGFLVPALMASEILKEIEQISPVRQFARVWTIPTKSLDIPCRKSIPTAQYEGEAEAVGDSNSLYRSEKLTAHRQSINTPITNDLLNYANFNMESELIADAALAFAQGEGLKFLLGTGAKQPEGILVNADVSAVDTANSGTIVLDDVIKLAGNLKVGYKPIYFFNRGTLVKLRTDKDSNGNYLWQIGGTTMPTQINGFDYVLMQDMPNIADGTGARICGFGDLYRGYSILDSLQMSIIRDALTLKKKAMVEFTMHRYNTGQVVMPEAIKLLKIKA